MRTICCPYLIQAREKDGLALKKSRYWLEQSESKRSRSSRSIQWMRPPISYAVWLKTRPPGLFPRTGIGSVDQMAGADKSATLGIRDFLASASRVTNIMGVGNWTAHPYIHDTYIHEQEKKVDQKQTNNTIINIAAIYTRCRSRAL